VFKLGEVHDAIFPAMGGVSKDNALAAQYYLKAAQSGYAPAQSRLIRVYATGAGVQRNYFNALWWLLRFLLL
jgi:TPR repeat protein